MNCTCTEDKYIIQEGQEVKVDVVPEGYVGVVIGRNRIICQSCIDNFAIRDKQRRAQDIVIQLNEIDRKSIRAIRTSDAKRMFDLENEATTLRNELASL